MLMMKQETYNQMSEYMVRHLENAEVHQKYQKYGRELSRNVQS